VTHESPVSQMNEEWLQAAARVERLVARVFDPEVKALIRKFSDATVMTYMALDVNLLTDKMWAINERGRKVHERIGMLLPDLF
jgi:hypothetical protein